MRLSLLLPALGLAYYAVATERKPPSSFDRGVSPNPEIEARALLEKREDCGDGGSCLLGHCCGDGCAYNCCGLDQGGVGCGMLETCDFVSGSVFIGCCGNLMGGCTGTPTIITIHTPYHTVTFTTEPTLTTTEDDTDTYTYTTTSDSTPEPTATATTTSTTPRSESTTDLNGDDDDDETTSGTSSSTDSSSDTDFPTPTDLTSSITSTFPTASGVPFPTLSLGGGSNSGDETVPGAAAAIKPNVGLLAALAAWFFF